MGEGDVTNTCGPFGTYGCGCVSTDPRMCAQIRYGVNPDPDCQRCECLCHEWRTDDHQLARVEKQAQTDWKIGAGLDCDDDSDYLGGVTCWGCGGSGIRIVCMDDLCRNSDHCIHGDGEEMCDKCNGEGAL